MPDRKWSELADSTPQDSDGVALQRGTSNFRWTFLSLRTWLEGFFSTNSDLTGHDADAAAHGGVEANYNAHAANTQIHVGANTAGAGLTHSAGVLDVGAGDGIVANADDVAVDLTVQRAIGSPTNGNIVQMNASGLVADGGVLAVDLPTINRTDDPTGPIKMAVVVTLPGTPDADTLYFVTG